MFGPSFSDICQARIRLASRIHRTPLFRSQQLDNLAGCQLLLKCENLQKTGSFKVRGALNAVLSLTPDEARHGVVTHSSGNHGAALAWAARQRGIPAWIVVPENTPAVKQRAIENYGGRIIHCAPTLEARESTMRRVQVETGATLIHPYDDDRVIAGQGTAALEALEDAGPVDAILAPVSGGGLLAGTAIAATSALPGIRVIGCEPAGADDAFRSLRTGQLQRNQRTETIADGLRAALCERTFAILRERVHDIVLVSEEEIIEALYLAWERLKLVIEPSAAVALATVLFHRATEGCRSVCVILSGGNVDVRAWCRSPLETATRPA
jgi:threonine dehydratase